MSEQVAKLLEHPQAKAELVALTTRSEGFAQEELDLCVAKWLRKLKEES